MHDYNREIFINFYYHCRKLFSVDELIVVEKFIEDPVAHLQIMCASRGVSLSEICKRADVDRSTVERWKEKNPTTLAIISRLQNALKEIPTI